MALNISLKPRERLVVNGAVLRNRSSRHPLTLEFLNKVNFMRERELLMPEQAVTPLLRVVYWLQMTYIDPDQRDYARARFLELAVELHRAVGEPTLRRAVRGAVELMQAGRFGAALKALRAALPLERALLGLAVPDGAAAVTRGVVQAAASTPAVDGLELSITEEPFDLVPGPAPSSSDPG